MSKIVIFENEYASVWCYPQEKIIHHQMHKYTPSENIKEFLMAGAHAMKQHKATKWLSDDRNHRVVRADDMTGVNEEWEATVQAAGWQTWAIVQPEHIVAKMRFDKLVERYEAKGVTVEFFTDPDDAMAWLKNQS